jgi:transcriptional regulator with XRE-family HTH domain
VTDRLLLLQIGAIVRDLRRLIGWTQRELASRARVSQSLVSAIENGRLANASISTVSRLLEAMGSRLILDATRPQVADRERQRDAGHVRCVTYVVRRLVTAGWQVATEVEIGAGRTRGWIDILAFHPGLRLVLVIEVKTELSDFGALERQVGWYEREAWAAGRRLGWRASTVHSAVLLLASEAVDARLRDLRASIDRVFPGRARELTALVAGNPVADLPRRSIAAVDPLSRRSSWIRPTWIDGRRTRAAYADYVGFLARLPR